MLRGKNNARSAGKMIEGTLKMTNRKSREYTPASAPNWGNSDTMPARNGGFLTERLASTGRSSRNNGEGEAVYLIGYEDRHCSQ